MTLDISTLGVSAAHNTDTLVATQNDSSTTKVAAPPPPPPPPPPPKDVVQLSLAAEISSLQHQGESPTEISQALGLPVQTVSIYLGSSFIEAALASAPTVHDPTSS